ncbi:MAG: DNA recombination protein RmuC [Proteobacteria bacterium]|nr:DNA recombination protein RmuC [Pseudomonadota bacterium]
MNTLLLLLTAVAALAACAAAVCAWLALRQAGRPAEAPRDLTNKLLLIEAAVQGHPAHVRDEFRSLRDGSETRSAALREELRNMVASFQQALEGRFGALGEAQAGSAVQLRKELTDGQVAATEAVARSTKAFGDFQRERLDRMELAQKAGLEAVAGQLKDMREAAGADGAKLRQNLAEQLEQVRKESETRQDKMRETLTLQLDQLRKENEAKLEQMRLTVDEKLQGTLEQRLGESFKLVSDRLDLVHKGLGEMTEVSKGVGDLKRVLTDVRQRGAWGEVQLSGLLEDMLTPEQYERQAKVRKGSGERVDFAVRLPGSDDEQVLLPIDCKFPQEDYDRLLHAHNAGDPVAVEAAAKALEGAVRRQAKSIEEKYVEPPATTNFAIMYLPTEGLFAEVVRRPGLAAELQQKYRVTVTGPTTLAAVLNSLRMGFTTLSIQKRSSEVWTTLGVVKSEFEKYAGLWDKVADQLRTTSNTVENVRKKTGTLHSKLRNVQSAELPVSAVEPGPKLLSLAGLPDEDEAA